MASQGISTSQGLQGVRGSIAALIWGVLSFLAFLAVLVALAWPIGQLERATALAHPLVLGVWAFAWVIGSGLAALIAARVVFGAWPTVGLTAWLLLLTGAVLSAAQIGVLADWTIARFGVNEVELVGPMALLFGVIAGVAVAGFGVLVSPQEAAWAPFLPVTVGVFLALSIVASNAPGLSDGLAATSGPLAVVTIASAVYVVAVGVRSFARARRRG